MASFYIWLILGIIAVVLLIIFWQKRTAVWGGLTLGIIIGLTIAIFFVIKGSGFNGYVVGKSAIVGTLFGFGAELLGKVSDLITKNK